VLFHLLQEPFAVKSRPFDGAALGSALLVAGQVVPFQRVAVGHMNRPVACLNCARVGVASVFGFIAFQVAGKSPSAPLVVREPDGELVASLLGVVADEQPLACAQSSAATLEPGLGRLVFSASVQVSPSSRE